jgi:hypothetical protein
MLYAAHEYHKGTLRQTGRIDYYDRPTLEEAVEACLYTQSLRHGSATLGFTGKVVHAGDYAYSIVPNRSRNAQDAA